MSEGPGAPWAGTQSLMGSGTRCHPLVRDASEIPPPTMQILAVYPLVHSAHIFPGAVLVMEDSVSLSRKCLTPLGLSVFTCGMGLTIAFVINY